ncbi:MAG: T9SS type A sorting domain-containing protein [Bacteroidetes bacterium]|nr:T9SS type A sorting domain-containing protein [Bacteroidota bacterium]
MKKIFILSFAFALLFSDRIMAQTPIFPYGDAFDAYTAGQLLNGNGGLAASGHVYVTPHGIVGNCAEFQMTAARIDSLSSPPIGPLTNRSAASFYFRVIKYVGGVATPYTLTGSDGAEVYVADVNFQILVPQYPINSGNQNTDTNYVKVVVPAPSWASGSSGGFRIVATNNSGNSWLLQLDSFAVRDTAALPPVLTSSVVNSNCRGDSTGSVTVHAAGVPPYSYVWSTGSTDSTIAHLRAGAYSVTVTDSAGGTATLTDTVRAPQLQLLLDSLTHENVSCYGTPTGAAAIYPRGGTPAYSYDWGTTPVQTTQQAQNLPAGTYSVTVTDANGCSVTATTQVTQPPALVLSLSSTTTVVNSGTATAIVNGGTSPFSYFWTPSGQTTAIATGLYAETYTVVVTDAQGCTISDSVRVTPAVGIQDIDSHAIYVYPIPASSMIHLSVDGQQVTDATITISDLSGRIVLASAAVHSGISIAHLSEGMYILQAESGGRLFTRRFVVQR